MGIVRPQSLKDSVFEYDIFWSLNIHTRLKTYIPCAKEEHRLLDRMSVTIKRRLCDATLQKKVRHIPCSRYRAIMYPLRRTPSKLMSKVIIVIIWLVGFAFALPMGLMHSFGYVVDKNGPFDQVTITV